MSISSIEGELNSISLIASEAIDKLTNIIDDLEEDSEIKSDLEEILDSLENIE